MSVDDVGVEVLVAMPADAGERRHRPDRPRQRNDPGHHRNPTPERDDQIDPDDRPAGHQPARGATEKHLDREEEEVEREALTLATARLPQLLSASGEHVEEVRDSHRHSVEPAEEPANPYSHAGDSVPRPRPDRRGTSPGYHAYRAAKPPLPRLAPYDGVRARGTRCPQHRDPDLEVAAQIEASTKED